VALALGAAPAAAEILGSGAPPNTTASGFAGDWNNVLSFTDFSGGTVSAVYLGDGYVLSAFHTVVSGYPSSVPIGGDTYNVVAGSGVQLQDSPNNSPDLVLFQVSQTSTTGDPLTLPAIPVSSVTPGIGATVYSAGFGPVAGTFSYFDANWTPQSTYQGPSSSDPSVYSGYYAGATIGKTWGTAEVSGYPGSFNIGYGTVTPFTTTFAANTFQLSGGDSGGPVFNSQGVLVGINDAIGTFTGQPGSAAVFGNQSYFIDLSTVTASLLAADPSVMLVPEPGGWLLGAEAAAVVGLFGLRRRFGWQPARPGRRPKH